MMRQVYKIYMLCLACILDLKKSPHIQNLFSSYIQCYDERY